MSRFLLFAAFTLVLLACKLFAVALVYHAGPIAAIPVIAACLAIAHIIENRAAKQE